MNNLTKIRAVWSNLEDNYKRYCKEETALTREEYLKTLLAFECGKPNLTLVRSVLGNEINTYSGDDAKAYDALFSTMERVGKALVDNADIISNLDEFCYMTIDSKPADKNKRQVSIVLSDYNFYSVYSCTPIQAALAAGAFTDYAGEGDEYYSVDTQGDFYKYFKNSQSVALFIYKYRKDDIEHTVFNDKVYAILIELVKRKSVIEDFSIIAPELYVYQNNRVTIGGAVYKLPGNKAVEALKFEDKYCTGIEVSFLRKTLNTARGRKEDVIFVR